MARKIIITCAVTGSIHTPTMSPWLPVTPDEIAEASIGAARAGAAIIHLHARDPETGRPSADPEHFMQFLARIRAECDAVVNISTGGSSLMSLDERLAPLLASPDVTAALFDLAGLEYIGSAGIRVLVKTRKALEARGGGVAVANLQPMVRQVFEIVKALPSADLFATDAELDAYLDAMLRRASAGGGA